MLYRGLADLVVLFHFCFIAFVLVGGVLILRWRRVMWLHLPAIAWGIFVEWSGWMCPLTPLENRLRQLGGLSAYSGDFLDRHLSAVIYPQGLTRNLQVFYGCVVAAVNLGVYTYAIIRWRRERAADAVRGFAALPSARPTENAASSSAVSQ